MTTREPEQTETDWRPYCGWHYPLSMTAGTPIVCTLDRHDPVKVRHYNAESGFHWWDTRQQGGNDDGD